MDAATFAKEDRKYSALWQNGYMDANWGRMARKALITMHNASGKSIVDFGFGRGSAMDYFEGHGFHPQGVDISAYAVEQQRKKGREAYQASLDNLHMFPEHRFNAGFCNDVMEHIPEENVAPSLDEMARVCSEYLFISVCPTPSHHLSLEGENLHLTVRPVEWWEQAFSQYGDVERLKFWLSRSARYVVYLRGRPGSAHKYYS
ncbi:MAG: methyltransferase domain-containing protein [Candidatus Aenigmarchaeota archaeon]|nr:methyltransferase domain-containing protein [Candidatus Aenigmarchaeota archaeon]